jgi:hypothetical protein
VNARLIPSWTPPDRVNWVDYEQRNQAADGVKLAARALAEAGAGHTIFMADSGGYRTYETLCLQIQTELQNKRGAKLEMEQGKPSEVYENYQLVRFPAP